VIGILGLSGLVAKLALDGSRVQVTTRQA